MGLENIYKLKYYNFYKTSVGKLNNVLVSRTGYTGEIGFEIYVKNKDIKYLWNKIFSVKSNLKPIGLAHFHLLVPCKKGFDNKLLRLI